MAYVYTHIRSDNNQIFYVGVSTDDKHNDRRSRAYSSASRTWDWHEIAKETEVRVEIPHTDLTLEEALKIEIDLIKEHGLLRKGGKLANRHITSLVAIGGAKPVEDKKAPVTFYVPQSRIDKLGDDIIKAEAIKAVEKLYRAELKK